MHAEIHIDNSVIMLANVTDKYKQQPAGLFIYVDNCDIVYEKAVASGASVISKPADQEYGRSGGVKDVFGNT